jgi:uncharacterized protein YbjT (DUF2867 family)
MGNAQRVLVLGASGLIGRAVLRQARGQAGLHMLPASHRQLTGYLRIPYETLDTPEAWQTVLRLHRVDAVVSAVGIWQGSSARFERLQFAVPVALFQACAGLGLRVVHLGALGLQAAAEGAQALPYVHTKLRAQQHLLAHCPGGVLVLPSLVYGAQGQSTRFFLQVARLPLAVDFGLPPCVQPVHVDEVAAAVLQALTEARPPRVRECAGRAPVTPTQYLASLRAGLGLPPARWQLRLPRAASAAVFRVGGWLGHRFVNLQTWRLLQAGTTSRQDFAHARPAETFAGPTDLAALRVQTAAWAARLALAFVWLWTAWVSWAVWPREQSLAWLAQAHPVLGQPAVLAAASLLDAGLGLATLLRPGRRLWLAQVALVAAYTGLGSLAMPWAWQHPLGPLSKNLPLLALLGLLAALDHNATPPGSAA